MALIIAGTYNLDKILGMVAGRCAVCGELSLLRAKNIVRMDHAWFIPLSSRKLLYTELKCKSCGGISSCDQSAFAGFLPEKEANSLHVGEVLRRTNPALANTIAHRAELEDAVRTGAETRDGLDPRVALAFAKISDLDRRDQRVIEWHAALTQWSNLDEPARSRLLNEINAKVAEQQRRLDCIHFVRLMTTRFKPDVGGLFQMLPIVMPVFVGLALLLFYAKHSKNHLVPVLLGSFVGAFVFGLLVNGFLRRQMHKRFFRKVLLPESEVRNIDIGGVMDLLGQVDVHDQRIDPRVSAMAKSLPLLKGLLAEQNRYLELQPQ